MSHRIFAIGSSGGVYLVTSFCGVPLEIPLWATPSNFLWGTSRNIFFWGNPSNFY